MRDNFDQLCDAIDIIMATAKVVLFDKNAVKKAKGHHYQKKNEDISMELKKFLTCFDVNVEIIVSCAQYYELEKRKLLKTKKPCQLPLEEDIQALHAYY